MKTGGENLQQLYNPGLDFILNTYGAAENIIPSKNVVPILSRGIVIEVDFNNIKNYKLAAAIPPFSVYAKIIGEDLDVAQPQLQTEKIYFPPLLPMSGLSIPEIGEEVLILRESNEVSSIGFYIGRVNNTPGLGYYPARQYMDDQQSTTSPNFKYGFSFEGDKLRKKFLDKLPSDEFEVTSIPLTYGDVVQQGRSQTYIRQSFNKNNKKGVLEQGISLQQQNIDRPIQHNFSQNGRPSRDPSIGNTATKTIHFIDKSIKRLGDFSLRSTVFDYPEQNSLDSDEDKSMIVNMADEIYDISTRTTDTTLYRQVLGEKLIFHQQETNALIRTMLNGLTGLAQTTQLLLNAFVDHTHAIPKIDMNIEKTIEFEDTYRTAPIIEQQPDGEIIVIEGQQRTRTRKQDINFDTVIGGSENPRFTAPIQTDTKTPILDPLPGAPTQNVKKTELGLKTAEIDNKSTDLIASFNAQQVNLNNIADKASDFLSKNQFIN